MTSKAQSHFLPKFKEPSVIVEPIPLKINDIIHKTPILIASKKPMMNTVYKRSNIHNHQDYFTESKNDNDYHNTFGNQHLNNFYQEQEPISESLTKSLSISFNQRRKFSPEEDINLKNLIAIYGPRKWDQIALSMPGRTGRQCRDRFANYLDPSLTNGPWNREDDLLLKQKVCEIGLHWNIIVKFFPGRSTNNIKNRWYTYLCKQKNCSNPKKNDENDHKNQYKVCNDEVAANNYQYGFVLGSLNNYQIYEKQPGMNYIIKMNEHEMQSNQSTNCLNNFYENQNMDFYANNYKTEKKIFFPLLSPSGNNIDWNLNQGIVNC